MEIRECMEKRRSIRKYTGEEIPEEAIRKILEAGILAPSSMNIRPVRFVVVRERETLQALSRAKARGAAFLAEAACAVVVLADTSKADAWTEDCSLAMGYMMLMAESLGVASCWTQIRLRAAKDGTPAEENVRRLLGIPAQYAVEAVLSLGMAAQSRPAHSVDEFSPDKVIFREHFQ